MNKPLFIQILFVVLSVVGISISCHATIILIPSDFDTIHEAIGYATPGDTILLANGNHQDNFDIPFAPLTIASEYLLDHNPEHIMSTNIVPYYTGARVCEIESGLQDTVSIVGLTFRDASYETGGGSSIHAANSIVAVDHCIFTQNSSRYGTIYCTSSEVTFTNNQFIENVSEETAGALSLHSCLATIEHNSFLGNFSDYWGGAIYFPGYSGVLSNNEFIGNSSSYVAGAVGIGSDDEVDRYIVRDNVFKQNHSNIGGALNTANADTVIIENNIFQSNWVDENIVPFSYGGAVMHGGGYVAFAEFVGNEFYYNSASRAGGAVRFGARAVFHDNLLFKNSAGRTYALGANISEDGAVIDVFNNLFYGNYLRQTNDTDDTGSISAVAPTVMIVYENDFIDNSPHAAGLHPDYGGTVQVQNNYWGDPSGPFHETQNPGGLGDSVMAALDILPFANDLFTTRWLHAPEPVELISPDSLDFIPDDSIVFRWHVATDLTPNDTIRYRIEIAEDPGFTEMVHQVQTDFDTTATVSGFTWEQLYYWRVKATDIYDLSSYSEETRSFMITAALESPLHTIPAAWAIAKLYPNPFNDAVRIGIDVPVRSDDVLVAVYDLLGRRVAVLHDGPLFPGRHRLAWQPTGSTGVYLLHVRAGRWQASQKLVFLK